MMERHSIVARLNAADKANVKLKDKYSIETNLHYIDGYQQLCHGIGQILDQLSALGMYPNENAIDLAILAATVTAADTKISRNKHAQDSWSREIDLYIPVSNLDLWSENIALIERMLRFLTGDYWSIIFRTRQKGMESLIERPPKLVGVNFDSVCLFSGGLDSFVGAIDLFQGGSNPILVSHYRDASTKSQEKCADKLSQVYGDIKSRHVRANVSFDKNDLPGLETENTTRGRSFIFFSLACLAASSLDNPTPIYVPENGLISLNVPLDHLRLGAWSTRTTHPFYMARWQDLLNNLGIKAKLLNPYRFKTKGEMLSECKNKSFIKNNYDITISCSSIAKSRWKKQPLGHCGYCTPCLIRRSAIHTAFGEDKTTYSIDDLTAQPLNANQSESKDVRSFQMMSKRLAKQPELAKTLVYKTGPLNDYPFDEIENYAEVFRRGIKEVSTIVNDVVIKVT